MRKMLRIDQIFLDFQPAENLIERDVRDYVARMTRGEKIEPITVRYDGQRYLLENGFHRVEAARRLKASSNSCRSDQRSPRFMVRSPRASIHST
jgi:uncharacterized ParB-like nuclease family protein